MDNSLFVEIKEAISKWIKGNNEELRNNDILIEMLKDDRNCLRIGLDFGEILAEILVVKPDFAPFRYVSFQAVGLVNGIPDLLHFWYDNEESTIEDIINNLDKSIQVLLESY